MDVVVIDHVVVVSRLAVCVVVGVPLRAIGILKSEPGMKHGRERERKRGERERSKETSSNTHLFSSEPACGSSVLSLSAFSSVVVEIDTVVVIGRLQVELTE